MDLTVFIISLLPLIAEGCRFEGCTQAYKEALDGAGVKQPESSPVFCQELKAYAECIKDTSKTCRGDLQYHSTSSLLSHLYKTFNCSEHKGGGWKRPSGGQKVECSLGGKRRYSHCGLYGDPHLKSFSGKYQTCKVNGAWPLLATRYLAVQVTNMPVHNSSRATATTKITVIIKGGVTHCASEKTYEATADAPLPAYFIDGSDRTGPEGSVVLKATDQGPNQSVEIYLRYIDTTLIIRKVGDYLGFSGRVPTFLVDDRESGNEIELCRRGCPRHETLDEVEARGHLLSWEAARLACAPLTDHYLDWCIFDVMTAGDRSGFVAAARAALIDVLRLDPSSLQNRTMPLELERRPLPSSVSLPSPSLLVLTVAFLFLGLLRAKSS